MKLKTGLTEKSPELHWYSIDDRVMGGVSNSSVETSQEGTIVFSGTVSTEHGGGFASVRALTPGLDLGDCAGLRLRVKGDGRTYKINLKNAPEFDGIVYQASFTASSGEWMTVQLPFSSFMPSFRARALTQVADLDPAKIEAIGLMVSERQAGEFRLEIESIECY